MPKRRCWTGHLFASNVGVLPTVFSGVNPKLVVSMPTDELSRHRRKRLRQLRRELLRNCH
jgi:hypothetical protein